MVSEGILWEADSDIYETNIGMRPREYYVTKHNFSPRIFQVVVETQVRWIDSKKIVHGGCDAR